MQKFTEIPSSAHSFLAEVVAPVPLPFDIHYLQNGVFRDATAGYCEILNMKLNVWFDISSKYIL